MVRTGPEREDVLRIHDEDERDAQQEVHAVVQADARVGPDTVMVKLGNTVIALRAMLGSVRPPNLSVKRKQLENDFQIKLQRTNERWRKRTQHVVQ